MDYANRPDLKALSKERVLKSTYRLCADYFRESDFANPEKTKLIWSAVPSAGVSDSRLRCLGSEGKCNVCVSVFFLFCYIFFEDVLHGLDESLILLRCCRLVLF